MLHAATNGDAHLRELRDIAGEQWPFHQHIEAFGLVSGRGQLEQVFGEVTCDLYDDALEVTDADAVGAYLASSGTFTGDVEVIRKHVADAIARVGVFRIQKSSGVFNAIP